jgi:hypothetical protein
MQDAKDWGAYIVSAVPVGLWVAALICAGIAILRAPRPITFRLIIDKLLRYLFVFPLGVQGLWAFLSHVFMPEEAANAIGWEPSPFQYEVGVANLGLALASFYAAFKGFEARAATAIAAACFLAGAGVGHLMDIAQGDNLAPGNAGPILYTDFLTPIAILVLLLVFPRRPEPVAAELAAETSRASLVARIEVARGEAPPPRIEDEIEKARKAMRGALKAGPTAEVLPPAERPLLDRPRKGKRAQRDKGLPGPAKD